MHAIIEKNNEDGGSLRYIEDKSLRTIIDKYVEVMRRGGYSFSSKDGVFFYYIDNKPHHYIGEAPSAMDGKPIYGHELRWAVQSHIQSLKGKERFDELLYIEEKYATFTGVHIPIGQTTIYDYLPGGSNA
jgi:hypothetical protein